MDRAPAGSCQSINLDRDIDFYLPNPMYAVKTDALREFAIGVKSNDAFRAQMEPSQASLVLALAQISSALIKVQGWGPSKLLTAHTIDDIVTKDYDFQVGLARFGEPLGKTDILS